MSKFKVGDRIRWIRNPSKVGTMNKNYFPFGHLGTIQKHENSNFLYVKMDYFEEHSPTQEEPNNPDYPLFSVVDESDIELVSSVPKFKIGDRVRFIEGGGYFSCLNSVDINYMRNAGFRSENSDTFLLKSIEEISYCGKNKMFFYKQESGNWYSENGLELVVENNLCGISGIQCEPCEPTVIGQINNNNKKTIMSKVTSFVKNLTLSADEKLLRKYGLKNECGEYTSEAIDAVKLKLVSDNESYLIEIAKGLEAEENK
jgi:hypothetical protein